MNYMHENLGKLVPICVHQGWGGEAALKTPAFHLDNG
jgi:hypothetical protein